MAQPAASCNMTEFGASYLLFNPQQTQKQLLVWMHGLGDQPSSFFSFAQDVVQRFPQTLVCLPKAHIMPVTINQGMSMHAWYDIISLTDRTQQDTQGMKASALQLESLIENICTDQGIDRQKVVVGGFSQGAVMALCLVQQAIKLYAGMIIASGYLPLDASWKQHASKTKGLWLHGQMDDVVPWHLAKEGREQLKSMGFCIDIYDEPNLGHGISFDQWQAILQWLADAMWSSDGLTSR